jgi:hypothetical protein
LAAGDRAVLGVRETASSRVGLLRRERDTLPGEMVAQWPSMARGVCDGPRQSAVKGSRARA